MFLNREEAGIRLALKLSQENISSPVIVSIPRGGVVIGNVISEILSIPLETLVVKKIGAPDNPELAIGAVGSVGEPYWDNRIIQGLKIHEKTKATLLLKTRQIVSQREESLSIKKPDVKNKCAIVVDDGVATGATAVASSAILKELGASRIILATPVISKRTKREISKHFDKVVSVLTPFDFSAVGQFYREFPQVEDEEVREILQARSTRV